MILQFIRRFNILGRFYRSSIGKKWVANKLEPVLPHLSVSEKIIDIGSGNGMITYTLKTKGYQVTPLDVANLSIVPTVETVVYDGQKMPFENQTFDTALLLTVLHHCPDPIIVLKEAQRIAKQLIIIEDVYSNPIQKYLTFAMDTLVNFGHSSMTYQNKSDTEWQITFEKLGLQLEQCTSNRVLLFFRQNTYVLKATHF